MFQYIFKVGLKFCIARVGRLVIKTYLLIICSSLLQAEPWIDTRDLSLRVDIETLVDIGVITSPVTTYPIMWSNIVRDFDNSNIDSIPKQYKETYWRVKKQLRSAFRKKSTNLLRTSAASSSEILKSFGATSREQFELSARRYNMSDNWAWNTEITYTLDPYDGENVRLDGSYLATIVGNWNLSVGYVERWWGPTWSTANMVSNNARPLPALMLQRNYAEEFQYDWLKWIGPWTLNAFVGQLDDKRVINGAKLLGMSVTFKPAKSLEIGLRRSAQWGGQGRPETLSSFLNLLVGRDNCNSSEQICTTATEPGNQLAGVDLRFTLPFMTPSSIYLSVVGEDEAGNLPSKNIIQFGGGAVYRLANINWKWNIEWSDTAVWKDRYNITYEHHIYRSGYRYNKRPIGSTYDNDSSSLVFSVLGKLNFDSTIAVKVSKLEINRGENVSLGVSRHSISSTPKSLTNLNILWTQYLSNNGVVKINLDYFSNRFDDFDRQSDKYRVAIDWTYPLN